MSVKEIICPTCLGHGTTTPYSTGFNPCEVCSGTGYLPESQLLDDARIEETMERALSAFFEVVTEEYTEIKNGDLDAMNQGLFESQAADMIRTWLKQNTDEKETVPQNLSK